MKILVFICVLAVIGIGIGCKSKVSNSQTGATFKDVDVAGAKEMIAQNKDLIILDVRTPAETSQGTIKNAIIIDYKQSDFESKMGKLDKSKPYLVYCRSGGRSVGASNKMIAAGFTDVTNLLGGYTAWSK